MQRAGRPIQKASLKEPIDPQITFSGSFEHWQAAAKAGLDLHEWDKGERYTPDFKAKVIAWYRLSQQVELHTQDAVIRHVLRKQHTKGR